MEKAENELQRVQTVSKQETARCRLILGEMTKSLNSLLPAPLSTRVIPNESLSSEFGRFQGRLNQLVSVFQNSTVDQLAVKNARITDLENALKIKETELTQTSKDFSAKVIDMRRKMDTLNGDLEVLQHTPKKLALPSI